MSPLPLDSARNLIGAGARRLLERGVFAQGIRAPTVAPGTARLRVTLMATHTPEHVQRAGHVLTDTLREGA